MKKNQRNQQQDFSDLENQNDALRTQNKILLREAEELRKERDAALASMEQWKSRAMRTVHAGDANVIVELQKQLNRLNKELAEARERTTRSPPMSPSATSSSSSRTPTEAPSDLESRNQELEGQLKQCQTQIESMSTFVQSQNRAIEDLTRRLRRSQGQSELADTPMATPPPARAAPGEVLSDDKRLLQETFGLPPEEDLLNYFYCTFHSLPGNLYITTNFLCYAHTGAFSSCFVIPLVDIISIEKTGLLTFLWGKGSALEIMFRNRDDKVETVWLGSFLQRKEAVREIVAQAQVCGNTEISLLRHGEADTNF